MTFTRFLGIGIATIIYGLCTVGWADVKPIDPSTACTVTFNPTVPSKLATLLSQYKTSAPLINGQYVICFKQDKVLPIKTGITFQPVDGDNVVIYGLQLANDPASTTGFQFLSIIGNNVLLQSVQFVGPGNSIAGSIGVALSGSHHAIINSTITGFATAISVSGTNDGVQNSTLTGSGSIIAGTIGVALSGSGHIITANTITGFETAVKANCASPSPQPSPGGEGASCTIGPKNVTDTVKYGVVVPTTGQGVMIMQNEIRTIADPYGITTQKIFLQGAANGGLTPPTFSIDPATMTIWKTLSDDGKFVTEIGGVLPKTGTIELFEHKSETQIDGSQKYKDYFRASCPTTQNDKGQFEFKCTGLNIDAAKGQVFVDVTHVPNTSAMTRLIDVKNIPEYITTAINPVSPTSTEGGALTDPSFPSSPPAGDGGLVVGGAGETVAMNDGGLNVGTGATPPHPDPLPGGEGSSDGGTAAAMTGDAMALAGDGAPSAAGAASGCGGQLMPEKNPVDPTLFIILLIPIVLLLQVRRDHSRNQTSRGVL